MVANNKFSYGDQETKEQPGTKHILSKYEYDLYHEEDDVANKVIRVKHILTANKIERWRIMEDAKIVFTIEGAKLSNKERMFLRTVQGVNFLIKQCKSGNLTTFAALKREIKHNSI